MRRHVALGQTKAAAAKFLITAGARQEGAQWPCPTILNYGPDFLKVMTTAFDYAHESLPAKLQENDRAKRRLALLILRHIERGEHDPERLATSAVLDFFR